MWYSFLNWLETYFSCTCMRETSYKLRLPYWGGWSLQVKSDSTNNQGNSLPVSSLNGNLWNCISIHYISPSSYAPWQHHCQTLWEQQHLNSASSPGDHCTDCFSNFIFGHCYNTMCHAVLRRAYNGALPCQYLQPQLHCSGKPFRTSGWSYQIPSRILLSDQCQWHHIDSICLCTTPRLALLRSMMSGLMTPIVMGCHWMTLW